MKIAFDNSYARELHGFYLDWQAAAAPAPKVLRLNRDLADELDLDPAALTAEMLVGNDLPDSAHPLAQVYAGHQFGGFSPQLGDGRALLLGEVIDRNGNRRDIALKGSGQTPFSRGADGKAALGPVLREYLIGEAMHALGIPTTRALAAVGTGETVRRDAGRLPGAVLVRVASSHLRVGTFQFFAARGEGDKVKRLADYAIARHYPGLEGDYLGFFKAVAARQAKLIADWMLVGFIHGVMNTDNMTISGETIDYGPCAFMEGYAPGTVFSSIDAQGRYAYANQPMILGWNLARLAETLLPLIDADDDRAIAKATEVLEGVAAQYQDHWLAGMRRKLGLIGEDAGDLELAKDFLREIEGQDWTQSFRGLGLREGPWVDRWRARRDPSVNLDAVNPIYIPRNERVEEALAAAVTGDMAPFEALLDAIRDPFTERAGLEKFAEPASENFGPYRTYCGT